MGAGEMKTDKRTGLTNLAAAIESIKKEIDNKHKKHPNKSDADQLTFFGLEQVRPQRS